MKVVLATVVVFFGLCARTCGDGNWPPIGDLELPEYGSTVFGVVSVSGWALDFEDAVVTVNVLVDGVQVCQAAYPSGDRPDVQDSYPEVPYSLHSGFAFSLDTRTYPNGSHRIRVTATDPQNETSVIGETVVTFDNTATPTGRPWPDTSDRVYVFNDQIADGITTQQAYFAATHYVGCQKIVRSLADWLRIYNPNFLVLHYRLGLGLGYRAPDQNGNPTGAWLMIIEGNGWVREWPDSPQD